MSEVPLGAFLSGGVDSSAVVAMMAQVSTDPVNTCSIRFGESEFDESRYAAEVAERYRTNHWSSVVDPSDFKLVDRLASLYDEPFADSSAMPTYRVSELARRRVTVALSGDGGDENFGGYRRYRWHTYEERVRRLRARIGARAFLRPSRAALPESGLGPESTSCEEHLRGASARSHRGLLPQRFHPRRRASKQALPRFVPSRAPGVSRHRGFEAASGERPRASALARSVPGPQDLPSGRHPHQGRPREHGALSRSAGSDSGLRARRMGGRPSSGDQASGPGREVSVQTSDGTVPVAGAPLSSQDGLRRAARVLVPRAAPGSGASRGDEPGSAGHGNLRRAVPSADGRRAPVGASRFQRAPVVGSDVRSILPATGRCRTGGDGDAGARRRPPRSSFRGGTKPLRCGSSTSSITRRPF